ncbi:uncharacterized protein LOC125940992 [Dermacentor silvarum]|uniref:uncharacterized protein LOC125940992 n=1 Tax=Dermacentor silvarum TaxID=543639 RepID=UPI002101B7EB|nr:uncharacterized protein LOC125940992 [Dermacentor silvarum]
MIGSSATTRAPVVRLSCPARQIPRGTPRSAPPKSASPQLRGKDRYQRLLPATAGPSRSPARALSPHSVTPLGGGFALPAYGELGHPVVEQFETTLDESKTLFFVRRVSIFQVWQLFVMWLALTGTVVFIASVVGFRHILIRQSQSTTMPPYTHVFRPPGLPKPGEVNGTCDVLTPCQGEAECVDGRCICSPPLSLAVGDVCVNSTESTRPADVAILDG